MAIKEPTDRVINGRYSYTKKYSTLKEGVVEVLDLVPELLESLELDRMTFLATTSRYDDEDIAKVIFDAAVETIKKDFPSIYDDIYPATLALSITGDRFYYRSKNRLSLIWEYDRSFKKTGEVFINVTVQFKEPTNKLRSKIFTDTIARLKEVGFEYNPSLDEYSTRRRNSNTNSQDSETQQ